MAKTLSTTLLNPGDPSELGYPATLPIEVAMKTAPIAEICAAYNLNQQDWENLKRDPAFVADVRAAAEELKKDGVSFKMKARLQAEELLKTAWKMIHAPNDEVAPAVKGDMIKFIIRCAGLSEEKQQAQTGPGNALQININLGDR